MTAAGSAISLIPQLLFFDLAEFCLDFTEKKSITNVRFICTTAVGCDGRGFKDMGGAGKKPGRVFCRKYCQGGDINEEIAADFRCGV